MSEHDTVSRWNAEFSRLAKEHAIVRQNTISRWNAEFSRLAKEYAILRQNTISRWNAEFSRLAKEQALLRQTGKWVSGRADLLGIIGRSRHETFHSALLAWLLHPGHRQPLGVDFLQAMMVACFPDLELREADLWAASTHCEVVRQNSRADIVIQLPGALVVFEVKVDHDERHEQCNDLYRDFSRDPARFVFLTPEGRPPATATEDAAEAFRPLSFCKVREILVESRGRAGNPATGGQVALATLDSYLATLASEF